MKRYSHKKSQTAQILFFRRLNYKTLFAMFEKIDMLTPWYCENDALSEECCLAITIKIIHGVSFRPSIPSSRKIPKIC